MPSDLHSVSVHSKFPLTDVTVTRGHQDPAGQVTQDDWEVAPSEIVYLPAPHGAQNAALLSESLYVPCGHLAQYIQLLMKWYSNEAPQTQQLPVYETSHFPAVFPQPFDEGE